jgi:hypothetical protein
MDLTAAGAGATGVDTGAVADGRGTPAQLCDEPATRS